MLTYKQSGVDIDEGNRTVDLIKGKIKSTYDNNVIAYKVWLAKSPVEKSEKAELERGYSRGLVNAGNINIDHAGVYSRLLMGLAWELGGQKL